MRNAIQASAHKAGRKVSGGFSLIEVLIAMTVLAVGLLGGISVICVASASNGGSKLNTAAATLAESAMERITAIPENATGAAAMTTLTDCKGNVLPMDSSLGGSPLVSSGLFTAVDYRQPPVLNYSMLYTVCSAGPGITYDVRWRIDPGPTPSTQLVTVSVKGLPGAASPAAALARPVTLQTLRGDK